MKPIEKGVIALPDFLQLTRKNHLLFKRIPITTQRARSLDSEGNTLFTRAITLPLFSKLVTFVAIKNETHNKGWKVEADDKKFHRFLIRPSKQIYYIGSYAFATTLLRK